MQAVIEMGVAIAIELWQQGDKIIDLIKGIPGVAPEDVDKVVARNRAERAAKLAADRASEWPK